MKKLSNKILLGFFGFILLYMIVSFTEIRFRGDKRGSYNSENTETKSLELNTPIRYVTLSKITEPISIIQSSEARIDVTSQLADQINFLDYEIKGDTLEITGFKSDSVQFFTSITLHLPGSNLREITSNGANNLSIMDFKQSTLTINQSAGRVTLRNPNQLDSLNLNISDKGYFYGNNVKVNQFTINADNSEIQFYSDVNRLNGSLTNQSFLRVNSINDIQFKKDETSKLYIQ